MDDYKNDIDRYLKGEMTSAERHAFEKKALSDAFLAEALEGAEQLNAVEFSKDVDSLNKKINEIQLTEYERISFDQKIDDSNKKSGWVWPARIAASLVLIVISGYFIWKLDKPVTETPLALEDTSAITPGEEMQDSVEASSVDDEVEEVAPAETAKRKTADQSPKEVTQPLALAEATKVEEVPAEKKDQSQPQQLQAKPTEEAIVKESLAISENERAAEDVALKSSSARAEKKQAVSRVAGVASTVSTVIRGKVTSREDGSALPGVNVIIKGTTMGAITDIEGNYQIKSPEPNPTLVFSFIGLSNLEVAAEAGKETNVQMSLDATQLSEVVVIGYGTSQEPVTPTFDLAHPAAGNRAFKQYLEKNIIYPEEAKAKKVEGRVTVEFFVEVNGSLTDFSIVRGIGSGCDEELIRLIQQGPQWIPTKKDGVAVRDKARVRLKFDLPK